MKNLSFREFQNRRQAYAYPTVALGGQLGDFQVQHLTSTMGLDDYHGNLLWNANDELKVMGYLSVIFWGHFSGKNGRLLQNRALGKVNLAYLGTDRKDGVRVRGILDAQNGITAASQVISDGLNYLGSENYGEALAEFSELYGISFAFASKICAFADPIHCGVMDSVIAEHFPSFALTPGGYPNSTRANQREYNNYCEWLQQKAHELNQSGEYSTWVDRDGSRWPWRAIDVERALY